MTLYIWCAATIGKRLRSNIRTFIWRSSHSSKYFYTRRKYGHIILFIFGVIFFAIRKSNFIEIENLSIFNSSRFGRNHSHRRAKNIMIKFQFLRCISTLNICTLNFIENAMQTQVLQHTIYMVACLCALCAVHVKGWPLSRRLMSPLIGAIANSGHKYINSVSSLLPSSLELLYDSRLNENKKQQNLGLSADL